MAPINTPRYTIGMCINIRKGSDCHFSELASPFVSPACSSGPESFHRVRTVEPPPLGDGPEFRRALPAG